jgi:glycine cleavage system H protein
MSIPTDLKYTEDHEWARSEDGLVTIGITDFAQGELGDIIFVEFPEVGDTFDAGEVFGTVEAVKTVADLLMPLAGEIAEINSGLEDTPESVNKDPYGAGWMVKIKPNEDAAFDMLMDSEAYKEIIG